MGQAELAGLCCSSERIDLKCELPAFDRSQTEAYMHAHLTYADGNEEIFTDKAVDEIYKYSTGSARAINKVCTHSLLSAAQRNKKLIDDHVVHMVIESRYAAKYVSRF